MGLGRQVDAIGHDKCGTKRALAVFVQEDGSVDGYCFKCGKYIPNPYGEPTQVQDLPPKKLKTQEQIEEEIAEITGYQTIDVAKRKLRGKTLKTFDAKVSVSEKDGVTPTAIYWPVKKDGKLSGYHVKIIDPPEGYNKAFSVGDVKNADLLNWDNAKRSGARRIIITEGPEDMASVYQICAMESPKEEDGSPKFMPAVVSLPFGVSSAKSYIQKHSLELKKYFQEVILCFDNDEAGQKAVHDCVLVLPEALSVTLPYKDANECILEGAVKAAYKALSFGAYSPKNTTLVRGAMVHEAAKQPAKYGELSWPWKKLNEDMRGIRLGETTYLGAGTKIGKTTCKNALAAHFIKEDKRKVFMACPEETNEMSYKLIANQLTGKIFHDPKIEFDNNAFEEAGEYLKHNLYMLSLYQFLGWDSLKQDIKSAVSEGCEVVMIDPITCLTNGINSADTNTLLQEFATELAAMAKDLKFHAFLFAHLKAGEGHLSEEKRNSFYSKEQYLDLGPISHEFGGSVYSYQFTGSRAMQRTCHLMLGLMGNKDPDLSEDIRNTRELLILEDRNWGNSAKYPLFYNKLTGQFVEM